MQANGKSFEARRLDWKKFTKLSNMEGNPLMTKSPVNIITIVLGKPKLGLYLGLSHHRVWPGGFLFARVSPGLVNLVAAPGYQGGELCIVDSTMWRRSVCTCGGGSVGTC